MTTAIPQQAAEAILSAAAAILSGSPGVSSDFRRKILSGISGILKGAELSTPLAAKKDAILTRREVAAMARRSTRTIDGWVQRGLLNAVTLPGSTRAIGFRKSEVDRLLFGDAGGGAE